MGHFSVLGAGRLKPRMERGGGISPCPPPSGAEDGLPRHHPNSCPDQGNPTPSLLQDLGPDPHLGWTGEGKATGLRPVVPATSTPTSAKPEDCPSWTSRAPNPGSRHASLGSPVHGQPVASVLARGAGAGGDPRQPHHATRWILGPTAGNGVEPKPTLPPMPTPLCRRLSPNQAGTLPRRHLRGERRNHVCAVPPARDCIFNRQNFFRGTSNLRSGRQRGGFHGNGD